VLPEITRFEAEVVGTDEKGIRAAIHDQPVCVPDCGFDREFDIVARVGCLLESHDQTEFLTEVMNGALEATCRLLIGGIVNGLDRGSKLCQDEFGERIKWWGLVNP